MLRTVLAIVVGVIGGGLVNMGLIMAGSSLIAAPAGMDVSDAQSVAAHAHLFEPRHFVFPFLAHALGTFAGALIAFLVAVQHRQVVAGVVGGVTLFGGISAAFIVPAPIWFVVLDLLLAYVPMAWLATLIGARMVSKAGVN